MNFKKITAEMEIAAKAKFLECGKGIMMSKLLGYEKADEASSKWFDLIDLNKFSEHAIVTRMKSLAREMVVSCDDPVLENTGVMFVHITDIDERIPFTLDDAYLFLRAALQHRRNSDEYRTRKAKMVELTGFIEKNKSLKEKRKDAAKELAELEKSM